MPAVRLPRAPTLLPLPECQQLPRNTILPSLSPSLPPSLASDSDAVKQPESPHSHFDITCRLPSRRVEILQVFPRAPCQPRPLPTAEPLLAPTMPLPTPPAPPYLLSDSSFVVATKSPQQQQYQQTRHCFRVSLAVRIRCTVTGSCPELRISLRAFPSSSPLLSIPPFVPSSLLRPPFHAFRLASSSQSSSPFTAFTRPFHI